jgi:3-oxoacyl-[acyl-carrier-protein] synthase III
LQRKRVFIRCFKIKFHQFVSSTNFIMTKRYAAITGVNGWVPDYILTNAELEKMVETNDEWIRSRTGISERRILKGEGLGSSYMGVQAVKGLLEKTNTDPAEIDLIICGTVTADYHFPANANLIAEEIGAVNSFSYDLNAACSGFLYSLATAARLVESGAYKKVVVVGADKMSAITDYTDRTTCILFGDAAGAVLLEPSEEGVGIIDAELGSNGKGRDVLLMKAGGSVLPPSHETVEQGLHYIYQEGQTVFKQAVAGMSGTIKTVMRRHHLAADDIAWLAPHQANMRIITSVANMADFPMERVMVNIQKYGNTTSATIPLCLWEWEPQLKKGDNIILTAFGGGFTWGSILVKWAYNSQ